MDQTVTHVAFAGHHRIGSGALADVALVVKRAAKGKAAGPLLIFDDATGKVVDVDLRGTDAQIRARYPLPASSAHADAIPDPNEPRGRGRPRLGVVAREVTLLPRHWDWLNAQPGGASVALRRLVEDGRRANAEKDRLRRRQEAAYRFMSGMAGDLAGFEEATRALFADDATRFAKLVARWPRDVRQHATRMAFD